MAFSPNALCFGDKFPASGVPCLVHIEAHGVTVVFGTVAAESPSESVLFSGLTVSAGGLDHDQLVVKWAGPKGERILYLKNADLICAFHQAAPDHLNVPLERAAQHVCRVRQRGRTVWGSSE